MPFEQYKFVPKQKLGRATVSVPACDYQNNGKGNTFSNNLGISMMGVSPDANQFNKVNERTYLDELPRNIVTEKRTANFNVGSTSIATKKINLSNLKRNSKVKPSSVPSRIINDALSPRNEAKKRKMNKVYVTDGADNLEVLPDHGSPTSSSPNTSDILPTSNQNLSSTISSNIISTTNDNTPGSSWYIDREPSDIGPDRPTSGNETNKISHVGSTNEVSKNKKLNNLKKPVKKVDRRKLKKSGILAIDVIKPSVYITADDKVPTYLTTSEESRGSVLLLNNIEFIIAKKKRIGADIDHINITKLFDEMGFRVSSHQNKTAKEMKQIIENHCKQPLTANDIQIVVIMSHGDEDDNKLFVQGTDLKPVQVQWIINEFNKCVWLNGKPKIFIFQCCRGNRDDNEQIDSGISIQSPPRKRGISDILLAYPTIPGYVSYRDSSGSRYINAICEVFMEHAHDTHVEDLLKMVDNQINNRRRRNFQTTSYENWGFKKCYLNPIQRN